MLNGHRVPVPPLPPITRYEVVRVGDGYEILKDGEVIGFDTRCADANATARSLADDVAIHGGRVSLKIHLGDHDD